MFPPRQGPWRWQDAWAWQKRIVKTAKYRRNTPGTTNLNSDRIEDVHLKADYTIKDFKTFLTVIYICKKNCPECPSCGAILHYLLFSVFKLNFWWGTWRRDSSKKSNNSALDLQFSFDPSKKFDFVHVLDTSGIWPGCLKGLPVRYSWIVRREKSRNPRFRPTHPMFF